MGVEIYPIILGMNRVHILKGKGTILIDGGPPGKSRDFLKRLEKTGIEPCEIGLMVLTHGHWDHVGSAAGIQAATGTRIAMHSGDKVCLEEPRNMVPPGACLRGRVFRRLLEFWFRDVSIPPAQVDIELGNEEFSLEEYGIHGKILPTPGHTPGSVSVLLDSGEVFVGDLAMNRLPMRFRPGTPIFADDLGQVKRSWRKLLELGAKTVYPAHGKPFSAEVFRRRLD